MKTLDNFIIERLKLNKETQIRHGFNEEYCIVVPFDLKWYNFCEKYEHWSTYIHGDYHFFVIPIKDIIERNTELKDYEGSADIYKIPDKYDSFEELKTDHENKKFCVDGGNLEKLKI